MVMNMRSKDARRIETTKYYVNITKSTFIFLGYAKIYVQQPKIHIHAHQVGVGLHQAYKIRLRSSFHHC